MEPEGAVLCEGNGLFNVGLFVLGSPFGVVDGGDMAIAFDDAGGFDDWNDVRHYAETFLIHWSIATAMSSMKPCRVRTLGAPIQSKPVSATP